MSARYAERTKVPVQQSQNEIRNALQKAGADQLLVFESNAKSSVGFSLAGRHYRIDVRKGKTPQDDRIAWRLMGLVIKAKLEAVREKITTIEREFLAETIMPDGQTMAEWSAEPLRLAYSSGQMPAQLLIEGPRT